MISRDEAERELRDPEHLETYLREHYPELEHDGKMCCFVHEEKTPSMMYTADNRRKGFIHCFGCGASFNLFELYAHDNGLDVRSDFARIIDELSDDFGLEVEKIGGGTMGRAGKTTAKIQSKASTAAATRSDAPTKEDFSQMLIEWASHITDAEPRAYLAERHISERTADYFGLGYDAARRALIIPTGDEKHYYKVRYLDKDTNDTDKYNAIGGQVIFNSAELYSGEPVYIVEGEISAMSIHQAGGRATALGSTTNWKRFIEAVDERRPTGKLIIALDNDERGRKTTEKLIEALSARNVAYMLVDVKRLYDGTNDANDALKADAETFKKTLSHWTAAAIDDKSEDISSFDASSDTPADGDGLSYIDVEPIDEEQVKANLERERLRQAYEKNNVAHNMIDFYKGIAERADAPCIPTGDEALDAVLDGGLYEGLYILGAMPATGKTTYALQLADSIARNSVDSETLFFSLEMSRDELIGKSISRLTYQLARLDGIDDKETLDKLSADIHEVTNDAKRKQCTKEKLEQIGAAFAYYGNFNKRVNICEGMTSGGRVKTEDIRSTIRDFIAHTKKRPVVFVDYLQIIAPHDPKATDKQIVDDAIINLKHISREFKIPVIVVSSFNRQHGYNETASMKSFRDSSTIEYSADVLFALQYHQKGIELSILKHRNGRGDIAIAYYFNKRFNCYTPRKYAAMESRIEDHESPAVIDLIKQRRVRYTRSYFEHDADDGDDGAQTPTNGKTVFKGK